MRTLLHRDAANGSEPGRKAHFGLMTVVVVAVGIVLATAGSVGWHMMKTSPSFAKRLDGPIPVEVAAAERSPLAEVLGATGEVRPASLVTLTAGVSARVETVEVDVGDTVASGESLVRFDPLLSRTLLEAARTRVEQTTAELARTEQRLERVRAMYDEGFLSAVLSTAQSTMDHAKGELERAEDNLTRVEAIYKQGLLAITDLEQAQATVEFARVRHDEAAENLLRVRSDPHSELEQAEADYHAAVLSRSRAEEEFVRGSRGLTVNSPVPGVVMERMINPGETPTAGLPMLTIGQIDRVLVEAKVAEGRVDGIRLGMSATVTLSAFPNDTFTGDVIRVRPESDPLTQTFLIYVEVANPELKLKPGMSSFVRIEERHHGLVVPSIALLKPIGVRDSAVFVVDEQSRARLRKVRVDAVGNGMTEVIDGLAEGDRVVVVGQYHLNDGDLVRIGERGLPELSESRP